MIALVLGAFGMVCIPLVFWARKPIWTKFWYFKNKGSGGKIVDYFTSDNDHDVFCVKPDQNGTFKIGDKMHNIGEGTVKWSRFYDARLIVCQDTSMSTIDPIKKDIPSVPPELIQAAIMAVKIAEQKKAFMLQKVKDKEWMMPAVMVLAGLAAILAWLTLQGQADVILACAGPVARAVTTSGGAVL